MSSMRALVSPQLQTLLRPQVLRTSPRFMRIQTAALSSAISDAIIQDHRELEKYYNEVINSTDHDHQQRFGNQFVWELARHSIGEELVVYPAFEKYMGPKGQEMADSDRQEHHKVKELLKQFQNMKSTDPDYVPKLKELWAPLWHHIQEEEKLDLPALEQSLKAQGEETETLARRFDRTKKFVPTRSHPTAGEKPPFETVMGLMAAPMDKLADMLRKFPDQSKL
ncbi:hypothetical protein NXS19_011313 [Fusarium pseudograminearum]|uniref:Hemerythrin-like domain-containing protein n=4 Tax=Fusarium pseudograminearum TaxID=101028 RepID=K3V5R9_FUSPC|nr:hypothetical protein FPSE_11219 [Fusarium pseudograminearum CS3096]UZP43501.1 hypothetical protein NXS19_011313 [Fusarium pseudograminearum]CEG02354.1 unnamed protein product [Fusarium pseudograminearum CS3220]CEG02616.1 unnamed protein product [Fusarium pseudograminearum CS3427]CEG03312.1 unnamed protein product [Fusarium pseudograminearum CS3487]EKJ68602.1 hypothetical protein FPSE_11219 [Fusarium pseudograminearum CS3096]